MADPIILELTKIIKAKRSTVFDAWTKADVMKLWLAPGELSSPVAISEPKQGGSYKLEMEGLLNGNFTKGVASGVFKEFVPYDLLVLTWNWAGGYNPPETVITVKFSDVEDGTQIHLTQVGFADERHFAGYQQGWYSAFEKLAGVVQ